MAHNNQNEPTGLWVAASLVVAAICVGILFYIGWFNNRTHVDSPNGNNVLETYPVTTAQAASQSQSAWQGLDKDNVVERIVTDSVN